MPNAVSTVQTEDLAALLTLSDQASSSVDTGRVELNELEILEGKSSTGDHSGSISRASVSRSAGEVGTSVTSSGKNGLVGTEAVKGSVLLVVGHDSDALAVLHDEVCEQSWSVKCRTIALRLRTSGEVLDEVLGVVAERLAVEGVKHSVTGAIGSGSAAVGLSSLSKLERLSSESALVDLALLGAGEGETVVLELENRVGSLAAPVAEREESANGP